MSSFLFYFKRTCFQSVLNLSYYYMNFTKSNSSKYQNVQIKIYIHHRSIMKYKSFWHTKRIIFQPKTKKKIQNLKFPFFCKSKITFSIRKNII